ncbi:helix-hairpin-helix domain-containing protein [Gracilibacillus dipsosauri]|uniref:helix-hairpin-helix domain-containing protein n=1 Tax=Gracilibacillus dipsosauri TaxID=178340 RepID=UPI00240A6075
MYWLKKYWYVAVIILVVAIWIYVNPSDTNQSENFIMTENTETTVEEIDRIEKENEEQVVMVDVKGEIAKPGVYQMEAVDRVQDVIKIAGGLTKKGDPSAINMAERVYDEMVIIIPKKGEEGSIGAQSAVQSDGKIKINTATKEEIMQIPGIGEVKANAMIDFRETNGRFEKIEDLTKVNGIGEKTLDNIRDFVQIP